MAENVVKVTVPLPLKNGTQQARMRFNVGEGQSGTKAR